MTIHARAHLGVLIGVLAGAAMALTAFYSGSSLASTDSVTAVPDTMSYQGYAERAGAPISGTVPMTFALYSGDVKRWEEAHAGVAVSAGYFAAQLGSQGAPLTESVFRSGEAAVPLSLEVSVAGVTLPRQMLNSVPYAYQAARAQVAAGVPWTGISRMPAGFADGVDDVMNYEHVIVVAKSGGNFTTVAEGLAAAANASIESRFLVWVAPGIYTETAPLLVRGNVHLKGAGRDITVITSSNSAGSPLAAAATLSVFDTGQVSDLTVRNTGTSNISIGIFVVSGASRATLIDNIAVDVSGAGGVGHIAIYLSDAEPTLRGSQFTASGAATVTSVNSGLAGVNVAGGFPQPLIEHSSFDGRGATSGFGIQIVNVAPDIRHAVIYGDYRGISAMINGLAEIQNSQIQVGGFTGAFLFETGSSASVAVANSGVFYPPGSKHTGTGGMTCVNSFKANYTAASDGQSPATACN